MKITVPTPAAMEQLGGRCAEKCRPGCRIFLRGELGAGKTTFVRGFLRGLGYAGKVKSPTYTLVEPYQLALYPLYHFDLYRLADPLELEAMGGRDYFDGNGVCLIEWPERAQEYLGTPDLMIAIRFLPHGREVLLQSDSDIGREIIRDLPDQIG